MRTTELADALEAWAIETLPAIQGHYDYATSRKTQPLPDVAIEIDDVNIEQNVDETANASWYSVEQTYTKRWNVKILLMVAPDPAEDASNTLADFIDDLIASALEDGTLGGRVGWVAKNLQGSFTPPFVEFDDQTRGRLATLEIAVYETISIEE